MDRDRYEIEVTHEDVLTGSVVGTTLQGQQVLESSVLIRDLHAPWHRKAKKQDVVARLSVSGYKTQEERLELIWGKLERILNEQEEFENRPTHPKMVVERKRGWWARNWTVFAVLGGPAAAVLVYGLLLMLLSKP